MQMLQVNTSTSFIIDPWEERGWMGRQREKHEKWIGLFNIGNTIRWVLTSGDKLLIQVRGFW